MSRRVIAFFSQRLRDLCVESCTTPKPSRVCNNKTKPKKVNTETMSRRAIAFFFSVSRCLRDLCVESCTTPKPSSVSNNKMKPKKVDTETMSRRAIEFFFSVPQHRRDLCVESCTMFESRPKSNIVKTPPAQVLCLSSCQLLHPLLLHWQPFADGLYYRHTQKLHEELFFVKHLP